MFQLIYRKWKRNESKQPNKAYLQQQQRQHLLIFFKADGFHLQM